MLQFIEDDRVSYKGQIGTVEQVLDVNQHDGSQNQDTLLLVALDNGATVEVDADSPHLYLL